MKSFDLIQDCSFENNNVNIEPVDVVGFIETYWTNLKPLEISKILQNVM